jgi:hypothetical protein
MEMRGEVRLALPRTVVWKKLNDPGVLRRCIPGCDSLERDGDGFAASVKLKVGPISARFKGRVSLTDLEPQRHTRSLARAKVASLDTLWDLQPLLSRRRMKAIACSFMTSTPLLAVRWRNWDHE